MPSPRSRSGFSELLLALPEVTQEAFHAAPRALIRAAKTLGSLALPLREGLLELLGEHPLYLEGCEDLGLVELVAAIDSLSLPSGSVPIRCSLRQRLRRGKEPTATYAEPHRQRILLSLPQVRVAGIRSRALDALGASLGIERPVDQSPGVRHALQLLSSIDGNRRGLRRAIRALVGGKSGFANEHPQSQAWLRAHPRLDSRIWLEGIRRNANCPESPSITLSLETDSLEVLRLGTYTGSCFGLGGSMAHSAAAIMLDVNRAVVFARAGSRVLARQVLAISTDLQLVAYEVYPQSASACLQRAFRDYDLALARALGLRLHDVRGNRGSEPNVELVLADSCWQDYPWDLSVEGAEPGDEAG